MVARVHYAIVTECWYKQEQQLFYSSGNTLTHFVSLHGTETLKASQALSLSKVLKYFNSRSCFLSLSLSV